MVNGVRDVIKVMASDLRSWRLRELLRYVLWKIC